MKCRDCNAGCLGIISDECIVWTGQSIPVLDIVQGQSYKTNIINLALKLTSHIEESVADLKSLYLGQGTSIVDLPVAVQVLIDYIIELRSSDIILDSNLYCLGGNVSTCAGSITKKDFSYSLSPSDNGITFTYNTLDTLNNLPPEITTGKFNVQAEGLVQNGSILIVDSQQKVGGFTIPVDRLPAVVTLTCRLGSSCGDIELKKRIAIAQPVKKTFNTSFALNDFSTNLNTDQLTQKDFNELSSVEICKLRDELESLQTLEISDCPDGDLTYPDNKLSSVIVVQSAKLCDLTKKVNNIGERIVKTKECQSNCAEQIYDITLQEWINKTNDTICQTVDLLGSLELKIIDIQARLNACCAAGGSGANSGSTTSDCPNGNCG